MSSFQTEEAAADFSKLSVEDDDQEKFIPKANSSRCSSASSEGALQTNTIKWEISDLQTVGVFYHCKSTPLMALLDMVSDQTGRFGRLTMEQKEIAESLQSQIFFNYSMDDITFGNDCLGVTQTNLNTIKQRKIVFVEDFLRNTVLMVYSAMMRKQPDKVSEAVFVDLFKSFVKMCGLVPVSGSEWKCKQNILQSVVSSEADVILTIIDSLESTHSPLNTMCVVSVEEVNNMTAQLNRLDDKRDCQMRTTPSRNLSAYSTSSEESFNEEPNIFKRIKDRVLSQHGGELLMHAIEYNKWKNKFGCKTKKSKYRPGMIVVGTQVTLTLFDYNYDHHRELKSQSVVENGRSCIYYSEQRDFLKKEDRDILLEAFIRMTNTEKV